MDGDGIPRAPDTVFLFRLDRLLDDADGGFSGLWAGPTGDLCPWLACISPTCNGELVPTHPGLDMVAGALPFRRWDAEDGVGAGTGSGCGCGDACATRCRLGLRADEGDSVATWAGLGLLFFRFRVLGPGVGVGGIGGGAGTDEGAAVVVGVEAAARLAA
jgi:hypothetical protein